ncbi:hook-length control protein FliK [Devosia sp. YR412]|uniref:flagellar hook-length control protein FliK n=1 Tax=Devosia sp. YR412 TaxID=1881030 RepID=UPI0008C2DCC3|nr:flagellar hook-length control protein FliK [Devosia sp. YR412]SEQ60526.1 hook-length control protein FliK [Devosia sp. YR412]
MPTIPSQLPQPTTAARTGTLQALALQSGQMLDAKIIGAMPNGGTQVEIRGQLLNLMLPVPVKPGDTIQLQVQGAGQQMKLALQVVTAPVTPPASPAPAAPPPQSNTPLAPPQAQPAPQPLATAQAAVPPPAAQAATAPQPYAQPLAQPPVTTAQPAAPQAPLATQSAPPLTQAIPPPLYPQSPANPNPVAVAHAATAAPQPAPAVSAPSAGVAPIIAAAPVGGATSNPLSGNPTPQFSTAQAALAQMVHTDVPQQGSITALTTALTSLAGKVVLPEPVVKAAQQVLAGRVAIDAPKFDGAALQSAIRGSGIFQESALAQSQSPLPQTDMKTALLTLRQTLTTWLGQQAPTAAVSQIAPPLKGQVPRARPGEAPPIDPDAPPEEIGKHLLERTESALARTRLHQHASLPDPVAKTADWSMDLPVLIGQHQTLMQFQIHRDQQGDSDAVTERGWQMRFAINLPELGEVGAQVSLRAGTTGVMLWASDPDAAAALNEEVGLLREALSAADLRLGAVIVRSGEPPAPAVAPSGHFLDARS